MQATDNLQEDHLRIRRMLGCLEKLVARAEVEGQLDGKTSLDLLGLFSSFADGDHQEKEERVLMPRLLARASLSEEAGIRELAKDHAGERKLMLRMHSNLLGAIHGEPLSLREFVRTSKAYVELHRKHMAHEEALLLPMTERLLTSSDDRLIVEGFESVESAGAIARVHIAKRIESLWQKIVADDNGRKGATPRDKED